MSRFGIPQMHNTALGLQLRNQSDSFRHMCSGQEKAKRHDVTNRGRRKQYLLHAASSRAAPTPGPACCALGSCASLHACLPCERRAPCFKIRRLPVCPRLVVPGIREALGWPLWAVSHAQVREAPQGRRRGRHRHFAPIPSPARSPRESRGWGRARQARRHWEHTP